MVSIPVKVYGTGLQPWLASQVPVLDEVCGTGVERNVTVVLKVWQSNLEHLKQVQTVVNRGEQQPGQNVLNSFFKTFTN